MSFVLKSSRDGSDIRTAAVKDQEFNSEVNSLKIGLTGLSSSTANGNRTVEITHGMGIAPAFICYFQVNNNGNWFFQYCNESYSGYQGNLSVASDETKVYFHIYTNANINVSVYYNLFYDPIKS